MAERGRERRSRTGEIRQESLRLFKTVRETGRGGVRDMGIPTRQANTAIPSSEAHPQASAVRPSARSGTIIPPRRLSRLGVMPGGEYLEENSVAGSLDAWHRNPRTQEGSEADPAAARQSPEMEPGAGLHSGEWQVRDALTP